MSYTQSPLACCINSSATTFNEAKPGFEGVVPSASVNFILVINNENVTSMLIDTLTGKIVMSVADGGLRVYRNIDTDEIVIEMMFNASEKKGHCYRYIAGKAYPMSRELEVFPEWNSNKTKGYIEERNSYAKEADFDCVYIGFDSKVYVMDRKYRSLQVEI